jgi:hypothetical protein
MERPSVYLVEKADALRRALEFFTGQQNQNRVNSSDDKRLAFLAQIDFWHWEVENLLYSYESFKERSEAWKTFGINLGNVNSNGLMVRAKILSRVRWSQFYETYSYKRKPQTVAPHEMLNSVIDQWNSLLDLMEKEVLDPNAANLVKAGMMADYVKADLSKYRIQYVAPQE